jgi:GDP-L-fucose synthase
MSDLSLAGQRIAVTGGDGFIGRQVLQILRDSGADPLALVGPNGDRAAGAPVDLRSADDVADALSGAQAVIHLAARAGGVQFQQGMESDVFWDNVRMTANVLSASMQIGVRRCFLASSAVVYTARVVGDIVESTPLMQPGSEPVSPYAWSKVTDEVAGGWANASGRIEVVAGRFTNVFGPGASFDPVSSTVVHALVKKVADAGPEGSATVWGDGSAVRSFVHVRDCAAAVAHLLAHGIAGDAYNISTSGPVTIRDLATTVQAATDPSVRLTFDASKPTGAPRRVLDSTKLAALGFEPNVSLEAGIRDVVRAYREQSAQF